MKKFIPIIILLGLIIFSALTVGPGGGDTIDISEKGRVDQGEEVLTNPGTREVVDADPGQHTFHDIAKLSVSSYHVVEIDEFISIIDSAHRSGQMWTEEPISVAMHFASPGESRIYGLVQDNPAGELPTSTTVTVVRDGLLDDSVRSIWNEFYFERDGNGMWILSRVHQAYRCWRPGDLKEFSARLCS